MSDSNSQRPGELSAASGRSGPNITLIFFAVVVALAVVFFLQNGERVSIDFLVFEKLTTIRWSILMATVLGVLLDRIFTIWWRRRKKKSDD
ncbi:MAG: hypothetical protein Q7V88_11865 [Actinomycetota bacterium]|nr:hypothetical protein [Actinomycetota bacterium]